MNPENLKTLIKLDTVGAEVSKKIFEAIEPLPPIFAYGILLAMTKELEKKLFEFDVGGVH